MRDEKPLMKAGKVLQSGSNLLNYLERKSHSFAAKLIDALEMRSASQAAYEGSIPFARSNHFND